jgi:phage FluMu protein Com
MAEEESKRGILFAWNKKGISQLKKDKDFHFSSAIEVKCPQCGEKAFICIGGDPASSKDPTFLKVSSDLFQPKVKEMMLKMHAAYQERGNKAHKHFAKDFGDILITEKIKSILGQ